MGGRGTVSKFSIGDFMKGTLYDMISSTRLAVPNPAVSWRVNLLFLAILLSFKEIIFEVYPCVFDTRRTTMIPCFHISFENSARIKDLICLDNNLVQGIWNPGKLTIVVHQKVFNFIQNIFSSRSEGQECGSSKTKFVTSCSKETSNWLWDILLYLPLLKEI